MVRRTRQTDFSILQSGTAEIVTSEANLGLGIKWRWI